jgi:hypothetical protein
MRWFSPGLDWRRGKRAAAAGRSWARASSALRCLPFRRAFYERVGVDAISSAELCRRSDWRSLCFLPMGVERAEAHFIWLIRLGVLRREVDGQGLTERVRLTPFGRELLQQWPAELPRASLSERIHHNLRRHRPRL